MRPKKLTLCGWGPYKTKQEIDFTAFEARGIFLITGATGAGKTTIFDAITYALYGALSGDERDKERNSVRSDFADPNTPTYVELVMEHGGAEYRILRNPEYLRPRRKRGGGAAEESKWVSGTSGRAADAAAPVKLTREKDNAVLYYPDGRTLEGTREVNAALQELLVLDYQQFKKISMIAQGEFARMLVAPPREKTRIFREIFGTGIYERFTAQLGIRARKLYADVMEQKAKLEEDVGLLTVGLEKSSWQESSRQRLGELTAAENWNYQELENCLGQMEEEASGALREQRMLFARADKEVEKLAAALSQEEENNRRAVQLRKASEEREALLSQAQLYQEKEKRWKLASHAGFVESAELAEKQAAKALSDNRREQDRLCREKEEGLAEVKALEGTLQRAEKLRGLLQRARELEKGKADLEALKKQATGENVLLQKGQERYLAQETVCRSQKEQYEEEDQKRKYAAIGLAARLLVDGQPCPVCGSLSHPAPAMVSVSVISEEALQALKAQYEESEERLRKLHEELVAVKTRLEGTVGQRELLEKQCLEWEETLLAQDDPVCREYLELPVERAERLLTRRCERASALTELLQEKERQSTRLTEQEKQLSGKALEAERGFAEALEQYGFCSREGYEAARLPKAQREALQQDIEDYRGRVRANQELYRHLKETVKPRNPADLEELKEELQKKRQQKEAALKLQRVWERQLSEVRKTGSFVKEKRRRMETLSGEYGYVKDLENMASGNNAKKLVFEQYVLAGYFEEILRAANIRFRKMTAGRYEMSRVDQVGDGRVKDNLEIQVLDYYTGKYRSVRTLSGGESFKASLSLALGMSDVIQCMNGGIRVDTLFVDEGFGALDDESLNQACDALMGLAEKNCLIGIISHVPELRERISQQLVIDKTSSGSMVRKTV